MRLTHFTDYTLRVLIYLGARHDGDLATTSEIATAYGISQNHLGKIVHHLARQGYVETIRGKGGGMRLARAPKDIRIGDVVRGAEVDLALVECIRPHGDHCPITSACGLQDVFSQALTAFLEVLDRYTLADLLKPRARLAGLLRNASRG